MSSATKSARYIGVLDRSESKMMQLVPNDIDIKEDSSDRDIEYIEGYLATKYVDKYGDIFTDGALLDMTSQVQADINSDTEDAELVMKFADLDEDTIKDYYDGSSGNIGHNTAEGHPFADPTIVPAFKIIEVEKDEVGMFIRAELNTEGLMESTIAAIRSNIKNGYIKGFSIEFLPVDYDIEVRDGQKFRIIKEAVVAGAALAGKMVNPAAKITDTELKEILPMKIGQKVEIKAYVPSHEPLGDYSTTESEEWSAPDFEDFKRAYGYEEERFTDLSDDSKREIAAHFAWLAADDISDAEYSDLMFPHHDPLAEGDLDRAGVNALRQRLKQSDLPKSALESIDEHAAEHLREDFDEEDVSLILKEDVETKEDDTMAEDEENKGQDQEDVELKEDVEQMSKEITELKEQLEELKQDDGEEDGEDDVELKEDLKEMVEMKEEITELKEMIKDMEPDDRPKKVEKKEENPEKDKSAETLKQQVSAVSDSAVECKEYMRKKEDVLKDIYGEDAFEEVKNDL